MVVGWTWEHLPSVILPPGGCKSQLGWPVQCVSWGTPWLRFPLLPTKTLNRLAYSLHNSSYPITHSTTLNTTLTLLTSLSNLSLWEAGKKNSFSTALCGVEVPRWAGIERLAAPHPAFLYAARNDGRRMGPWRRLIVGDSGGGRGSVFLLSGNPLIGEMPY